MTITVEQLTEVIRRHRLWVAGDAAGERANLRGVDLRDVYLIETGTRSALRRSGTTTGPPVRAAEG